MADYRLYLLNDLGHVIDAIEFVRDDDAAAEAEALTHFTGGPAELWNLARVVRKYPAGRPTHRDRGQRRER